MAYRRRPIPLVATVVLLAGFAAGCGSDDEASDLSPAALEGRDIVSSKGCAACHGANGAGGVGPSFIGLAGSEVLLETGETVIADRDYLAESIREPDAKIVDGFNVPMPTNQLTAAQIDAVITYIEALAGDAP